MIQKCAYIHIHRVKHTHTHTHNLPGGGGAYPEEDPNSRGAHFFRDVLKVSYTVLTVSMSESAYGQNQDLIY